MHEPAEPTPLPSEFTDEETWPKVVTRFAHVSAMTEALARPATGAKLFDSRDADGWCDLGREAEQRTADAALESILSAGPSIVDAYASPVLIDDCRPDPVAGEFSAVAKKEPDLEKVRPSVQVDEGLSSPA